MILQEVMSLMMRVMMVISKVADMSDMMNGIVVVTERNVSFLPKHSWIRLIDVDCFD